MITGKWLGTPAPGAACIRLHAAGQARQWLAGEKSMATSIEYVYYGIVFAPRSLWRAEAVDLAGSVCVHGPRQCGGIGQGGLFYRIWPRVGGEIVKYNSCRAGNCCNCCISDCYCVRNTFPTQALQRHSGGGKTRNTIGSRVLLWLTRQYGPVVLLILALLARPVFVNRVLLGGCGFGGANNTGLFSQATRLFKDNPSIPPFCP
jgi:hypothetical protein